MKCCWVGGHDIAERINGFARVIRYKDTTDGGEVPDYAVIMWEGQVEKGIPKGFCRYIYGLTEISFIGYMDGFDYTQKGMGLFFEKDKLIYSGVYEDGTNYENERPENTITDLSELVVIAAAASCGKGFVKDPLDAEGKECIKDPKIEAIEMFTGEPLFVDYRNNDGNGNTEQVETYWTTTALGGGPLIGPLSTPSQPEMGTPLADEINNLPENYGFYTIFRINEGSVNPTTYYDVWILTEKEEDAIVLSEI